MNEWKTQVSAVMSASAATTGSSKCDLPEITVTERCTCSSQQVDIPHYCQSYEKK